jgi:DNA-binding NtrC family response regulator
MLLEKRVLGLVEDDPVMGESLVQRLEIEGAKVEWWRSVGAARRALAAGSSVKDAIICDIRLPDGSGEDVFLGAADGASPPPFLFMTGYADVDQAVRLIRSGAGDYLAKPFDMGDFLTRLSQLIGDRSDMSEPQLGVSAAMLGLERLLLRISKSNSNVLITGETGVGKEVCARYLHQNSAVAKGPFIAVNCAAIPEELLESELFGHEKGAFSGAATRHLGYAERAAGGTLFLDEIGELSPRMQSKLLRLIEGRTFSRVGGETTIPFDARLLCATNIDLRGAIKSAKFREDLFYRINVVAVEVPPLRVRPEDVVWLAEKFMDDVSTDRELCPSGLSELAVGALKRHAWPGNVRELRTRIERASLLALGPWIMPGDLFPELGAGMEGARSHADAALTPLDVARDEAERNHILRALESTGGAITPAAKLLRISRTTMWEKMRRLNIDASEPERAG